MTLTSNQVSPIVDKPDIDQRPGTSDIAWAERAYHHQRREPANELRCPPHSGAGCGVSLRRSSLSF
jgi:hypothetical protein